MKKVALISDGWKRLIVYAWVAGIKSYIDACDEDICLYQFNCHGNWSTDELYNQGEYNIYNLPELSEYDGIILDCLNIRDEEVLKKLIEHIKRAGVPVVSIACNIEGFYYVGIDNYRTIEQLINHLYTEHGCRSYIYAGGPRENYENMQRVQAYKNALTRLGIDIKCNPVWYGDYDFDTGVRYFKEYVEGQPAGGEEIKFPDAFVCANDNIATGLCHCAQNMGYRIPEDFRVTGFDNLDKALYFEPQITTVSLKREQIGARCMEILDNIWNGRTAPENIFIESECIFTESCGCPNSGLLDYRKYVKNDIIGSVDKLRREEELIRLEGNMAKCTSYEQLFAMVTGYLMSLECDGFGMVIDKRLYDFDDEEVFPVAGYEKDMLITAYLCDKQKLYKSECAGFLKEYIEENGSGNVYMFTPIHFRNRTVGYSVLINGSFLYDNPFFYDIHNTVVKNMENLYARFRLEKVNKKLKDIYNRDQLTGLYNRLAYSEMIEPQYLEFCRENRICAVTFADADSFKKINDTYGHERGDEIIRTIAKVLSEECPGDGYVYRFGGDEFVAFFPCSDSSDAERFRNNTVARLAGKGIHISMGLAITEPSEKRNFEHYLQEADKNMYEIKNNKKRPD